MTRYKKVGKRKYQQLFGGKVFQRILIGTIILLALSLFIDIKLVIFLAIAIAFNSYLALFQLQKGLPTDFELSTFATVLTTMTFGLKWGLFVAVFSKAIASIYSGSIIVDHLFMILTYINAAFIASVFSGTGVRTLGMIIIIINCMLMAFISHNILRLDPTANISYTATNFIFNSVVFLAFSEAAYAMLTI